MTLTVPLTAPLSRTDFTTRKDQAKGRSNPQTSGSAAGYAETDPTPDY